MANRISKVIASFVGDYHTIMSLEKRKIDKTTSVCISSLGGRRMSVDEYKRWSLGLTNRRQLDFLLRCVINFCDKMIQKAGTDTERKLIEKEYQDFDQLFTALYG